MQNPYNNKKMLPHDSDMFFGREKEMQNIEGLLNSEHPQSVAIIGERRIGKSSLANRVFHKVMNDTVAIFLDCDALAGSCNSKDAFFQILNKAFLETLKKEGVLFNDYASFRDFIRQEKSRFIIFFDEFEHLPEIEFADNLFFSNLRSVAGNPENRLAFVTISQKSLKELTDNEAIKTSEFWNIFTPEIIGLLDDKSIADLRVSGFKKNNLLLDEEDLNIIEHYAGDFPFLNQIVCRYIFDEKSGNGKLNENKLESELRDYYETLWDYRSRKEQDILKRLKNSNHLEKDEDVIDLVNRGILKEMNKNGYRLFSGFFSEFIIKQPSCIPKYIFIIIFAIITGLIAGLITAFIKKDWLSGLVMGTLMGIPGSFVANIIYDKYKNIIRF